MALKLTTDNFEKEVEQFDGTVLVDFWAEWCGPCKIIEPTIEEIATDYKDDNNVKIAKLNIDENREVAQRFGIMGIPNMVIFKEGTPKGQIMGVQSKQAIVDKLTEVTQA